MPASSRATRWKLLPGEKKKKKKHLPGATTDLSGSKYWTIRVTSPFHHGGSMASILLETLATKWRLDGSHEIMVRSPQLRHINYHRGYIWLYDVIWLLLL